jgi:DNA-binding transcriptional LysR family regulator
MEFKQLKYFVGVAEALHYSNAAKTLYISQSALSQQILLLENEIGTALFARDKRSKQRKVELTEAGIVFLIEAKKILQMSYRAIETARRIGLHKEMIRFGIFKTSLKERLELIALFTKNFPEIELRIVELGYYFDVQKALMDESIDLGLTFTPLINNELASKTYKKGSLAVILPKNHILAKKKNLTLAELKNEKWIEINKPLNPIFDQIETACINAGFNRENAIIQMVTSLELMYSLVSLGIGIAFVPSFIDISKESNLVLKPLFNADNSPFLDIELNFCLAYKSDNASPLVLGLMGLI